MTNLLSERQEIQRVAQEYSDRGYAVVIEPRADQMPEFLRGTQPDILVFSKNVNIVIEVKQASRLKQAKDILDLARRVESRPDWRFELITVQSPATPDSAERWSISEIRERFKEAQLAAAAGYSQAAYLLAYAALEAALFAWIQSQGLDQNPSTSFWTARALARRMVVAGVLAQKELDTFRGLEELRNRLAHAVAGTEASTVDCESLFRLVTVVLDASALPS